MDTVKEEVMNEEDQTTEVVEDTPVQVEKEKKKFFGK